MKLGPVTKLDKRNTATSKNVDGDVMSGNCDVIVFFLIYGQFAAMRKPYSRRRIPDAWPMKLTFSFIANFYLTKTENSIKKCLTQLLNYCFEYKYCLYHADFLQKKLRGSWC